MSQYSASSNTNSADYLLAQIALAIFVPYYIWEKLSHWADYEGIYRYVSFFYYALIVYPLSVNAEVWDAVSTWTQYENLNTILAILCCFFYSMFALSLIVLLGVFIDAFTAPDTAIGLFFIPLIVLIPWSFFDWLFS
ncbi:hypothetical protein [Paraglaciecola aestuariivivens]